MVRMAPASSLDLEVIYRYKAMMHRASTFDVVLEDLREVRKNDTHLANDLY